MIVAIPAIRVVVDGKDITPMLRGQVPQPNGRPPRPRLVSLSISERRGEEADQLDLVIDDTDGAVALPPTAARIQVWLGWHQGSEVTPGLVDKGTYLVDEVSHAGPPDLITVRARAADFAGHLTTRRERSWHGTTLGAIVADIAKRHGLTPHCAASLAALPITAKAQSREGDLAFLRRLGREHDAVATIKRGALIFAPIGAGVTATGKPLGAVTIHRSDGDQHQFQRQRREEVTGVTASWHDRKGAKRQHVTSGEAKGARRLSRVYGSEAEAKRAATAAHTRAGREPLSFEITLAHGRADLHPEQNATVSGYKAAIDALAWLIAEVTHDLSERGFQTRLKLETK
ncbi:contractile injection system protein, VgrG/Pvc8 family [Sphingomonas aracearum]|uniref:Phage late control D family protein n=1 Tax=Sphingomonas aracearum TaxID=2283317 RepID=A0A369VT07_9SPHN|nr:contractile injection system protein, VgrG/Pvc8 family [Sphingomonas aracearum]RDE04677.1 phage late control D family protein [Sphingomonas aracearum]